MLPDDEERVAAPVPQADSKTINVRHNKLQRMFFTVKTFPISFLRNPMQSRIFLNAIKRTMRDPSVCMNNLSSGTFRRGSGGEKER